MKREREGGEGQAASIVDASWAERRHCRAMICGATALTTSAGQLGLSSHVSTLPRHHARHGNIEMPRYVWWHGQKS